MKNQTTWQLFTNRNARGIYAACLIGGFTFLALSLATGYGTSWKAFVVGFFIAETVREFRDTVLKKSFNAECFVEFYSAVYRSLGRRGKNGKTYSEDIGRIAAWVRWGCALGAVGCGWYLIHDIVHHASLYSIMKGGLGTAVFVALAVHMHCSKLVSSAIIRKNAGNALDERLLTKLQRAGTTGRCTHFVAANALLWSIVLRMVSGLSIEKVFIMLLPILPLWLHYTINIGYGALYLAEVDYALGQNSVPLVTKNVVPEPSDSSVV